MKYFSNASILHHNNRFSSSRVAFDKKELGLILKIYGKMVSLGEWRDYGISMLKGFSVFSIYRHASENPVYRVKKTARSSNRKEIFSVIDIDGKILKQDYDLTAVLRALEISLIRLVK